MRGSLGGKPPELVAGMAFYRRKVSTVPKQHGLRPEIAWLGGWHRRIARMFLKWFTSIPTVLWKKS